MNKKERLKKQWEQACGAYLSELLNMWELDVYYGYWIGDEVGGIFDYGYGMFTISMDDIIYCVEHDVAEIQYMEWLEYCCEASEFGFDTPNLKAWTHGCPRVTSDTFERLRNMQDELKEAVENEKERLKDETAGEAAGTGETAGESAGTVTKNDKK